MDNLSIITFLDERASIYSAINVKVKIGTNTVASPQFTIFVSPTGNCQVFSISLMDAVIRDYTKGDITPLAKEVNDLIIHSLLFTCFEKAGAKKILMVDIKSNLVDRFFEIFDKKDVVSMQPYRSTNNSEMTIIMVRIYPIINKLIGLYRSLPKQKLIDLNMRNLLNYEGRL